MQSLLTSIGPEVFAATAIAIWWPSDRTQALSLWLIFFIPGRHLHVFIVCGILFISLVFFGVTVGPPLCSGFV